MQQPLDILERFWGYTSFKPLQDVVINDVINGYDTLALMPTGGGKSMCFQIPALIKDGICIVVSPLVALMKDQVQQLNQKGIKALCLTSGISYNDLDTFLDNCIYGNYKFLYLSPERLQQELVQDRIRQMNVNLIAIDEAHCISQWGNDFRPAYKNISLLRELKPHVNCIALTASATEKVVDDIVANLDFVTPKIHKQSFERANLAYMVFHEEDKLYRLETILKKNPASSIVYVRNRKATLDTALKLEQLGLSATYYHGGLSNKEKEKHQHQWINNQKMVMVATNAFGMGIDKPDVKTVIHLHLPESIESYFQEAGRAGRNGNKAFAVILKNDSDKQLVENQFLSILPSIKKVKYIYKKLCNYFQISYGEGSYETFDFKFNHFCKTYELNSLLAYNVLRVLDRTSVIVLSKQFNKKTTVKFVVTDTALFAYLSKQSLKVNLIVKTILRTYGGIFEHDIKINSVLVSSKANIPEDDVITVLKQLEADSIISLHLTTTDAQITFIEPREDDKTINRISHIIKQQNELKHQQVSSILRYIENTTTCRSVQLLSYFGETNAKACGICSVCIQQKTKATPHINNVKALILHHLKATPKSSRELTELTKISENNIHQAIKQLLEEDVISVTVKNTYKINKE
ncbi:RecQ family ATP-dependent DNA helicase [Mangrovimonas spongiae]|uniref:ATP-dependent DNA helicase RecQ n=1 Tax=Mangrovimonas spongiae TaxID=2494697 RepID=A0A428K284_9FLAO|nr:RecQ family ATP-dependent DNA helicase [Mangrovimonas spongiae]RSK40394.1 RecQ family ATP-dependent DNA helicase [Mangrovimonas spongiae]